MKEVIKGFKIIILAIIAGFGVSYISAFTQPAGTPPSGNVEAPLNTSDATQTKKGLLIVGGLSSLTDVRAKGDVCTDLAGGKCLSTVGGGGQLGADMTGVGEVTTISVNGTITTKQISAAPNAVGIIANVWVKCDDTQVNFYNMQGTFAGKIGGRTDGGVNLNPIAATTIIPVSNGQFKVNSNKGCGGIQLTKIGEIYQGASANTGVSKIIAGSNITITPTNGIGDVTVNANPSTRTVTASVTSASWPVATAACGSGEKIVGGGGSCSSNNNQGYTYLVSNLPTATGWYVQCDNAPNRPGSITSLTATAYAICMK